MPCTSRLMSTDFTSSGCWREKASRRCTSVAARSAAWRQLASQARTRSCAIEAAQRKIEVADDRGQQIVEVVRDAAGEAADRFHLLRLAQRLLGRLAPRDFGAQHFVRGRFAPRAAQRHQSEADHRGGCGNAEDQMARHVVEPGRPDRRYVDAGRDVSRNDAAVCERRTIAGYRPSPNGLRPGRTSPVRAAAP